MRLSTKIFQDFIITPAQNSIASVWKSLSPSGVPRKFDTRILGFKVFWSFHFEEIPKAFGFE